jgi:hypothetical protein
LLQSLPIPLLILEICLPALLLKDLLTLLLDILPILPTLVILRITLLLHLLLLLPRYLLSTLIPGILVRPPGVLPRRRRTILLGPNRAVVVIPPLILDPLLVRSA